MSTAVEARQASPASGSFRSFLGYVVAFHLVWAAWPYVGYPRVVALGETTLGYAALNIAIRLAVWVAPVWVYLRCIDGVDPVE